MLLELKYNLFWFCILPTETCEQYNPCEQQCMYSDGTLQCRCDIGFILAVDGFGCTGNKSFILFMYLWP